MESDFSESNEQVTEFEAIEKIASAYSIPPDEVIWRYTKKQIEEIYMQIQKREVDEINLNYRMIRATRAQNASEEFLKIGNTKEIKKNKGISDIGVESDDEIKNHNPKLKIRG